MPNPTPISETTQVAFTTDPDGFALVAGARVLGNSANKLVRVETSYVAACQCCGSSSPGIVRPLVLLRRYERALGREMFWFGPPEKSFEQWRSEQREKCSACVAKAEARKVA